MRFRLLDGLLIIEILTLLLLLVISLIPSGALRIILGLPFLLFFPGYTLVAALFPRKEGMSGIERIALSFGMSIAVSALIGLGLNYTPWGIRLLPVAYSVAGFIIIMASIALFRRSRLGKQSLITEYNIRIPGWGGSVLDKILTAILIVAILSAVGVLGYTVANPKIGERFTEFYILGINGKAADYPTVFDLEQNRVVGVSYDAGATTTSGELGRVTLGIVNQEQQDASYSVMLEIDGQPADIFLGGISWPRLEGIQLSQGEKWEQEIGFAPQKAGDNQKVQFLLYKDGATTTENTLHLWINAREG